MHKGEWIDMAYNGADMSATQRQVPNGYVVHCVSVVYVCRDMMTDDCVKNLGTVGCYTAWVSGTVPPSAPSPLLPFAAAEAVLYGADEDGDGGSGDGATLGAILGGVLGGATLILIITAVVVLVLRRRRRNCCSSRNYLQQQQASDGGHKLGQEEDGRDRTLKGNSGGGELGTERPAGAVVAVPQRGRTAISVPTSSLSAGKTPSRSAVMNHFIPSRLRTAIFANRTNDSSPEGMEAGSRQNLGLKAGSASHGLLESDGAIHNTTISALLPADPYMVVTPLTPQRPDVRLDIDPSDEVKLLPRTLGKGSYGRVAEGEYQGQRVAVKVLTDCTLEGWGLGAAGGSEGCEDTRRRCFIDSLAQEVQVLGRCQHPNVVRLLAACLTPPRICLVMELMECSLDRLLYGKPGELLPLPVLLDVALDVAWGLEYLHPTIVHRDLKPGNVLITRPPGSRMVAKLSDFGLSRLRDTVVATRNPEAGTPEYMAPELFDVNNYMVTHQVDIYSFGVLLWTMLTGKHPWQGEELISMAYRVTMSKERLPLDTIVSGRNHPKLINLIELCWEHQPRRRPAAAEIVKLLLLVREQERCDEA